MRGACFAGAATETPRAPVFSMARATSPDALGVLDGGLEVLGPPAQGVCQEKTAQGFSTVGPPPHSCRRPDDASMRNYPSLCNIALKSGGVARGTGAR